MVERVTDLRTVYLFVAVTGGLMDEGNAGEQEL